MTDHDRDAALQNLAESVNQFMERLAPYLQGGDAKKWDEYISNMQQARKRHAELLQELIDSGPRAKYQGLQTSARMHNSTVRDGTDILYPLPLPNGKFPAYGAVFPGTLTDFLKLEGPALATLLQLYELPPQDQVVDARKALADYFYILPSLLG